MRIFTGLIRFNRNTRTKTEQIKQFMDNFTLSVSRQKGTRKIAVVGHSPFSSFVRYLESQCSEFDVATISVHEFTQWTKDNDPSSLPIAILINIDCIEETNIIQLIQQIEQFGTIPIIAIFGDLEPTKAEKIRLLKLGLDDCYSQNTSWEVLERRVQYLREFKKQQQLLSTSTKSTQKRAYYFGKRMFDILFSSIAIICLSPLFLLIGLAIKLESKGSMIYFSKRAGMGYRVFNFYKFRSMYEDADQRLKELEHLNQYSESEEEECFVKIKNDPRITFVGRFIRKTSLDELPQLLNVLKGDMSLVGNRPLPLYEAEKLTSDEMITRFVAPAGITGLWQVNGRGKAEVSEEQRKQFDNEYALNYSLWMDIKILIKTPLAIIQDVNV